MATDGTCTLHSCACGEPMEGGTLYADQPLVIVVGTQRCTSGVGDSADGAASIFINVRAFKEGSDWARGP